MCTNTRKRISTTEREQSYVAISYFPGRADLGSAAKYTQGFKVADLNDPHRIAKGISSLVWSSCIWLQGYRKEVNFEYADWCALDFDSGELSLDQAVDNYCDMIHVIGTTKSHQKAKGGGQPVDRFRVLLKFDDRIDNLRLYRWNMYRLSQKLPADPACRDGARFFFPCTEIVSVSADGYTQEINTDIPDTFDRPAATRRAIESGQVPGWVQGALANVIPIGERNGTIYRIAKDLRRCGFGHDAIVHMILNSRTYRGTIIPPKLSREIEQTVGSAVKRVDLDGPISNPEPSR